MLVMAIVAVVARVSTVVSFMYAAFRGTLICTAVRGPLMLTANRESCLAFRSEAVPVSCKASLGSSSIRYRVTAEPEGIMRAGIADCLSRRRAQKIPGHGVDQQTEPHDCCEPNASHLNILHLARSLCDPPTHTIANRKEWKAGTGDRAWSAIKIVPALIVVTSLLIMCK
jgi:hypothetical protein